MDIKKLAERYLIFSVFSSCITFIAIKKIIDFNESLRHSVGLLDFVVFHMSYIFIAAHIFFMIHRHATNKLAILSMITLAPLSLFEIVLIFEATNEALAFGYAPLLFFRVITWLLIMALFYSSTLLEKLR